MKICHRPTQQYHRRPTATYRLATIHALQTDRQQKKNLYQRHNRKYGQAINE